MPRDITPDRPAVADVPRSQRSAATDRRAERGRTFGRLLITYLAVTEALHVLWTGGFSVAPETIAKALVVPALQATLLECVRVVVRNVRGSAGIDSLARFYGRWLILAVTLAATTMTIDFVMARRVDLRAAMFFTLLVTPALQAAVLGDPAGRTPLKMVWPILWRHPLATPVLVLDGAILLAGWLAASHALIGMSEASVLQRRWMGTKLLAAAVVFSLWPARHGQAVDPGRGRRARLGLGLMLAGIAVSMFAPQALADAARLLSTVTGQPPAILLLEIYAGTFLMVVVAAIELRRTVTDRSVAAYRLIGWGTQALFVATLALLMNGFLSTQAVRPWAGLAATSGSVAATCFLLASLVLATRRDVAI